MGRTRVSRTIEAPIETAFDTVAHTEKDMEAVKAFCEEGAWWQDDVER